MEQADCHGFNAFGLEIFNDRRQIFESEFTEHLSLAGHALPYLAAQVAGDKRLRFTVAQVKEIRTVTAGNFKYVAKSVSGYQTGPGALAFRQRIDDHGGAVSEEFDVGIIQAGPVKRIQDAFFKIRGSGMCLLSPEQLYGSGLLVDFIIDEVGKGPSHVRCRPDSSHAVIPVFEFTCSDLPSSVIIDGQGSLSSHSLG